MMATDARSIRLVPTLAGGLVASVGILLANQCVHAAGGTDLDLPRVLGLTFRRPGQAGVKLAGTAWYLLSGGLLVPTLYWIGLRCLGRSGPGPGLVLAVAHNLAATVLLGFSEPEHPRQSRGEGRPMGAFLSHYGPLERWTNLLAHLGYGLVVGTAAGWRAR